VLNVLVIAGTEMRGVAIRRRPIEEPDAPDGITRNDASRTHGHGGIGSITAVREQAMTSWPSSSIRDSRFPGGRLALTIFK
jgi:hypothetical protein